VSVYTAFSEWYPGRSVDQRRVSVDLLLVEVDATERYRVGLSRRNNPAGQQRRNESHPAVRVGVQRRRQSDLVVGVRHHQPHDLQWITHLRRLQRAVVQPGLQPGKCGYFVVCSS